MPGFLKCVISFRDVLYITFIKISFATQIEYKTDVLLGHISGRK